MRGNIVIRTYQLYIIIVRPERNVRASLMPARWRAAGGGAGAAGGAVCAAIVGAAPLPRAPDLTPSTDLSTLNDAGTSARERPRPSCGLTRAYSRYRLCVERTSSSDRIVQTDESALFPRPVRRETEENGLRLDARQLAETKAGLPTFNVEVYEPRAPPPVAVAVAIVGAELPL